MLCTIRFALEALDQARLREPARRSVACIDATAFGKNTIFNFAHHRRIEHYDLITSRTGAVPPPEN